ncbi:hypothetical protein [Brumimicrobium oceani]|uniref:Uncharacterized protein n=1 Tax=Brumimicrobium oceani TaxID=2100725 RepID=A0A2U2XB97_9FLAO|nr:hypothetical protein [Brumimicrobium oceani]PWH85030.1 hypothetical protein DIT68_11710 [Brumimicrobium oceani]
MKKSYLIYALIVLGMLSCKKEDFKEKVNSNSTEISNFEETQYKNFKHEIIVYDETNKNYVMYALHSDNMSVITDFLNNNELEISTNNNKQIDIALNSPRESNDEVSLEGEQLESNLIIELVNHSFEANMKFFSLNIKSKGLKNGLFSKAPITYVANTNTQTHIGAIHKGYGYNNMLKYKYKENNWYSTLWKDYEVNGIGNWFIYPGNYGYAHYWDYESRNPKKVAMLVYQDFRQNNYNYYVFYSLDSEYAYSKVCPLGSYDSNNFGECYYGTVPQGSTAFTYNYGAGGTWFMYTFVNGSCPWQPEIESGSDLANCKVVKIPNDAVGKEYIWNRNLLIKSYKFSEL